MKKKYNLGAKCKFKCNFTPNLATAVLSLILVVPFSCFKNYVLFDCIEPEKSYNK